ncbi:MAG: damage repair protein [Bacilli bacterium]|nr:damage repair protein [Bacilli bacterium]
MEKERHIAVIDLKSFYATVECVERGLDPFSTALAVCDEERGQGTIVLAVSPYLRSQGVPSRCRRYELPHFPNMILARPQMELYVKKSAEIVSIFLDFVGEDDLHVYSIDESFLDLTPYMKLYDKTDVEIVKDIMERIHDELGLYCTAGIGPNLFLAKAALDIESKKAKDGIAKWDYDNFKEKLWPVTPLTKMWGISHNLERRFHDLGIRKIGDIAMFPKEIIIKKFGVIGEQIWNHANGIDDSHIREKYIPENKSLSIGQVLFRDYKYEEAKLIVREMVDDLCTRMRTFKLKTKSVGIAVGYSKPDVGGFAKQIRLNAATDDNDEIYNAIMIFYNSVHCQSYIRQIHIFFGEFTDQEYEQLNLFMDINEQEDKKNLYETLDEIKAKYGDNAILRGTAKLDHSTAEERHNQIGGHRK